MKNSRIKKLSAVISLVLVLAMVLASMPNTALAAGESESGKLVDKFYDEVVDEYRDDLYSIVYEYALQTGFREEAIAKIDEMIKLVEEYKAQIPEVPVLPEDPAEIPDEIPQEEWEKVPELLEVIPPAMMEEIPTEIIEQIPAETIKDIPKETLDKIPDSVLNKVPEETINQLPEDLRDEILDRLEAYKAANGITAPEQTNPVTYSLRSRGAARTTNSAYVEYKNYIERLHTECDLLLETLKELKDILEGDDLTTWEGLVDTVHYLEEELPRRIDEITTLWGVIAGYIIEGVPFYNDDTTPEQVKTDFKNCVEALIEIEDIINNEVIPAINKALEALADLLYDPACTLMEIFLEEEVITAEDLEKAIGKVSEMTEDEIKARIDEIIYDATHAEYKTDCGSHYLAFGNTHSIRTSYVDLLAKKLDVPFYTDRINKDMTIAGLVDSIDTYKVDIAAADLITLQFGEINCFVDVLNSFADFNTDYNKVDWQKYLGADSKTTEDKLKEALDKAYAELADLGVKAEQAKSVVSAIEVYCYQYLAHAISLNKAVAKIQEVNPDALIVVVGAYNPLSGATYDLDGKTVELGKFCDYLFDAFGWYDLAYAIVTEDVTYVDAPDVPVNMADKELTYSEIAAKFSVDNLQPSAEGHEYIADQIYEALKVTTDGDHAYGDWVETKPAFCEDAGELTRTCSKCGHKETKKIDPLGHNWGEWKVKIEATKDAPSIEHRICARCGAEETRTGGGPAATGDNVMFVAFVTVSFGIALCVLLSKRKRFN